MMQLPEAEIEQALQSLQNLSVSELQGFLDDEDTFNAFVNDLETVQKWESDKDMQVASNKSLAEYNLSLEPVLKDAKATLWELYERARAAADEVETKRAVLDSLSAKTSLDTTHALLQAASAEADEKSEEVSESFLNGTTDLETFTSKFVQLRILAHLRRLKTEKMGELVSSSGQRMYSPPYPM